MVYKELTDAILSSFYQVYNTLGFGFLEKVYENALRLELEGRGLNVETQKPIAVYYLNAVVGEYFADLLVEWKVIVELKAAESLNAAHEAQLSNYLKATGIEVGLLLNFGAAPEFKRKVFQLGRGRRP